MNIQNEWIYPELQVELMNDLDLFIYIHFFFFFFDNELNHTIYWLF